MSDKKSAPTVRVLVVDDESSVRSVVRSRFERRHFEIAEAESGDKALGLIASFQPTVIVTDLRMPGLDGFELLAQIKNVPTIIITGHGDKESAIKAVEAGAFAFFEKPFDLDALEISVRRASERFHLEKERVELLIKLDRLCKLQGREIENFTRQVASNFVGECPDIVKIKETFARLAKKPQASVLILGETGTGKEVAARDLHIESHGSLSNTQAPFVALNCSAIPPDLLESELYGHEKGAFSGATSQRIGLAEAAREGTLFLDEIGDMDPRHQTKLLRLVQERRFRRVGSNQELVFAGRIVAATHRDLEARSRDGLFREDLFYRLSVVSLTLPPLRTRGSDVLLLAEALCVKHGLKGIAPERVAELLQHRWPGNIRELNNWIERASILGAHDDKGYVTELVPGTASGAGQAASGGTSSVAASVAVASLDGNIKELRERVLDDFDRAVIQKALVESEFNVSAAAKILGLDRKNLSRRIKELNLTEVAEGGGKKAA